MGTNECTQSASKSFWDSQDFGDVSVVLKWSSPPGHNELKQNTSTEKVTISMISGLFITSLRAEFKFFWSFPGMKCSCKRDGYR